MSTVMRAAIYARYSSDLQRPASIDDQVRQRREEVYRRGWQDGLLYSDSEITGTVSRRRPRHRLCSQSPLSPRLTVEPRS